MLWGIRPPIGVRHAHHHRNNFVTYHAEFAYADDQLNACT